MLMKPLILNDFTEVMQIELQYNHYYTTDINYT